MGIPQEFWTSQVIMEGPWWPPCSSGSLTHDGTVREGCGNENLD